MNPVSKLDSDTRGAGEEQLSWRKDGRRWAATLARCAVSSYLSLHVISRARLGSNTAGAAAALPFGAADNKESPRPPARASTMARILVIEDEEMVRDIVRAILRREGHKVVETGDGKAGLEAYRKEPTDLVLADLYMLVEGETEVITKLREEFPNARIVAMSGRGQAMLLDALELGADGYVSKPFTHVELADMIRQVLDEPQPRP
jgi:CheY-like chemotaxis protein